MGRIANQSDKEVNHGILTFIVLILVSCLIACGLFANKAYAEPFYNFIEADISRGPVTITYIENNTASITYTDSDGNNHTNVGFGPSATLITISGTTTSNSITVEGCGADVIPTAIVLNNVDIANNGNDFCAFTLSNKVSVDLMLKEGSTNTLQSGADRAGLEVPSSCSLVISGTGTLNAYSAGLGAGIGGANNSNSGSITITNGVINARSSRLGSGNGAGIGGGAYGSGTVNITGGTITARAGQDFSTGAGIGGGTEAASGSGTITISGGTINAKTDEGSYGTGTCIGAGNNSNCGTITISGGTIFAESRPGRYSIGSGSGSSAGSIIVTGGSVFTSGDIIYPAPTNGTDPVYLNTLTIEGGLAHSLISKGSIDGIACAELANPSQGVYGIKDVTSDTNGKLYFYLPASSNESKVSLGIGTNTYSATYIRIADNSNTATLLKDASAPVDPTTPGGNNDALLPATGENIYVLFTPALLVAIGIAIFTRARFKKPL